MSKSVGSAIPTRATELYARTQETVCLGPDECYWCGAPCQRTNLHDNGPPVPFVKTPYYIKRPGNKYVCNGCKLFRRRRITVSFLMGGFLDRQDPANHSWWITERGAWAIRSEDYERLFEQLRTPPKMFVLSLLDGDAVNYLQLAELNNMQRLTAQDEIKFTINNVKHSYTIYEIEQSLVSGTKGRLPGVRELLRILRPDIPEEVTAENTPQEKKPRGRPTKSQSSPYRQV